ncbi:MAG: hypothetical protein IJW88_07935 [Alistipes sp.]|nr:hypothetical protein [Alistipes sp.]
MKRINPQLICKTLELDIVQYKDTLRNLSTYIEQRKDSDRFAETWYDFICACSTSETLDSMDIAHFLVHLESMLLFLINNQTSKRTASKQQIDKLKFDVRERLGLRATQPSNYHNDYLPIQVIEGSKCYYWVIALALADAYQDEAINMINSHQTSNAQDTFDAVTRDFNSKISTNSTDSLVKSITDVLSNWSDVFNKICEDVAMNANTHNKLGTFALQMKLLTEKYKLDKQYNFLDYTVKWRNNVAHEGYITDKHINDFDCRKKFARYILTLAMSMCPMIAVSGNNNTIFDWIHENFLSGQTLDKGIGLTKKVIYGVQWLGSLPCMIVALVLSVLWIGYYTVIASDKPQVDYSSVPETKRIELYDKILTKQLTERYLNQMQEDIKMFNQIKTQVDQYEANQKATQR